MIALNCGQSHRRDTGAAGPRFLRYSRLQAAKKGEVLWDL